MMKFYVKNWRCIEEVDIELSRVNIFMGKNSTGKSSLAYAAYFLSKLTEWKDPNSLAQQLFATSLDGIIRRDIAGPHYPQVIQVDKTLFEAKTKEDYTIPTTSPWKDSYLLPSGRVSALKYSQLLSDYISKSIETTPSMRPLLIFTGALTELMKALTIPPLLLFIYDWVKVHTGKALIEKKELGNTGTALLKASTLLSLLELHYIDYFTNLEIPLHQAPDGFIDILIIKSTIDKAPEGSLIVIEEPENFKNPLLLIDLTKEIVHKAIEKHLTIIMTTHNDLLVRAIAKAIEEGTATPSDIAIYYLERSKENPWTKTRRIAVYEDGTVEEYPHAEGVITKLF